MPEEVDLLKLVCRKLENANILYMLTGSLAANFYAVPRMTRDIDFVIEIHKPDIERFVQCFHQDFYIDRNSVLEAVKHQNMFNAIHNNSVFKIDFIVRKDTSYRTIEFQRRVQVELDGEKIWIVSPEDLILSKLHWAKDSLSELQIRDVKNLLTSIRNLDWKYIQDWVRKLGLDEIFNKAAQHG